MGMSRGAPTPRPQRCLWAIGMVSMILTASLIGQASAQPISGTPVTSGAPLEPSPGSGPGRGASLVGNGKRIYPLKVPSSAIRRHASATTPGTSCSAVTPGPAANRIDHSREAGAVAFSAAHNLVRGFSVDSAFNPADDSLAAALQPSDSLTTGALGKTLSRYASALSDTCALEGSNATLRAARVARVGKVALVRPGTGNGPITLPSGTEAGVIDLRDLPAVDGLDAALGRAISPFLHTPVVGAAEFVRINDGPTDEVFAPGNNVYSATIGLQPLTALATTGPKDLPVTLLTDSRMAPEAVKFAGALRMARRAYLAGSDVQSAAGEMTWTAVGDGGLDTRTRTLDQLLASEVTTSNGQVIHQDDANDPSTASYRRDFVASSATQRIDVTTHGDNGLDIDLYLLEDLNGDGVFTFPDELVAVSASPGPNEHVALSGLSLGGHYQILVHGWSVPAGTALFDTTTTIQTGSLWPDVIRADFPDRGGPAAPPATIPPPVTGPATRSTPLPVDPSQIRPIITGKGQQRAALVIAHGLTRRYYKYFDVEGDQIDARLIETLAAVDRWNGQDRVVARDILRRFGEALHDGHQTVFNYGPRTTAGFLALYLEQDDAGRPVVRRSAVAEVNAGDTILSIDGRPIEQIYADQYHLTSAATSGFRFVVASGYVSRMTGPETLVLADPKGAIRTVLVDPQPLAVYLQVQAPDVTDRLSGLLADLNAPDIAYLNLNGLPPDQVDAALTDANQRNAKALVVDMRGYPGTPWYTLGERLIRQRFISPSFVFNHFDGPDLASLNTSQFSFDPVPAPAWNGPIVLLTGPHAVSQAESFMQELVAFNRPLAIVGQQSAGTTGNITGAQLPGGFAFGYTGMLVTNPDGSRFMGVGIQPDVRVAVTAADLASGTDRDLLTAIDILHRHGF